MQQVQDQKKENDEMLDANIKEFIAATRQYFFGLMAEQNRPQQALSMDCAEH
jgi:hypothetical protein